MNIRICRFSRHGKLVVFMDEGAQVLVSYQVLEKRNNNEIISLAIKALNGEKVEGVKVLTTAVNSL